MKKVLFATTALIATGGMAAADVNLSGAGRFGIVYNGANDGVHQHAMKVEKRMTVNVDGSGSTDGGLSFGGRIRLRSDEVAGTAASAANVFLGNDMVRVTVGNTDGALLNRMGYFGNGNIGLTGTSWSNISFNMGTSNWTLNSFSSRGGAAQDVVRVDFNAGDLGVSLSTDSTGDHNANETEDAIALSYSLGDWTVGLGAADDGGTQIMTGSARGTLGDFGIMISYTSKELLGSKVVLAGSYAMGDTNLTGFIANTSEDSAGSLGIAGGANTQEQEYGLGFSRSLGGASLKGGISQNYTGETMADLGVSFGF